MDLLGETQMKISKVITLTTGSLALIGMAAVLPAQAEMTTERSNVSQNQPGEAGPGDVGDVYQNDARPEDGNNSAPTPGAVTRPAQPGTDPMSGEVGDVYQNDARPETGNTPTVNERPNAPTTGSNLFNERDPGAAQDMNEQTGFPDSPQSDSDADVGDVYNSNMGPERSNVMRLRM